ncbi:hypothetical protein HGRIS_003587 [Hohenbuehelia grisea]|uniref:F-box domain-containing protein n=1 Tax=Hohenbuehelia grisea TaxID=104357 RepID=A0ABR3JGV3_9AGAR
MIQLPPELWLKITSYIKNADEKNRLLSVNRVFYDLAMEAKYRSCVIDDSSKFIESTLPRLREAAVAERVQSLTIRASISAARPTNDSTRNQKELDHTVLSMLSSGLTRLTKRVQSAVADLNPQKEPPSAAATGVADVLGSMKHVSDLTLHVFGDMPFLRTLWSFLGSNLRELSISVALEYFPAAFNFDSLSLPRLQFMGINIAHTPGTPVPFSNTEECCTSMASFVNACGPTLQCFSIMTSAPIDLSPFFGRLNHFPSLTSIGIHVPLYECYLDISGLSDFLKAHDKHITELLITPTHPVDSSTLQSSR